MIQDIYPHKLHNEYDNDIVPCKDDIVLCFDGENLLVKLDGKMIFPKVSDFEEGTEFTYLFKLDDQPFFLLRGTDRIIKHVGEENEAVIESEKLKEFELIESRSIRYKGIGEKHEIFALYTGKHLADWGGKRWGQTVRPAKGV